MGNCLNSVHSNDVELVGKETNAINNRKEKVEDKPKVETKKEKEEETPKQKEEEPPKKEEYKEAAKDGEMTDNAKKLDNAPKQQEAKEEYKEEAKDREMTDNGKKLDKAPKEQEPKKEYKEEAIINEDDIKDENESNKDEYQVSITSKIKVYQCSGTTESAQRVLKNNNETFEAEEGIKSWIIFDCNRYELKKIRITFKDECVPEIIKFKMSDVAPRYAFNIASTKKFTLKTTQSWNSKDWKDIELTHNLILSGNEYNDGFKRYIQFEFNKYQCDKMQIIKMDFFGKLSHRIQDDDEQFEQEFDGNGKEEEKKDNTAPYKPEFVDSSQTQQGFPLQNIWKPQDAFFWMAVFGSDPYLVLDIGNNPVQQILVKAYPSYIYKTLKLSTSDKSKSDDGNHWILLIEDNEMESKMLDGATYDLTKYDIKKYIKLEFFGLKMQMFALSQLKLYGNSEFLVKEEKELTLDDIKNMKYPDQDLMAKYREKLLVENTEKTTKIYSQINMIEQDPNKGKLCDEWIKLKLAFYENNAKGFYLLTPVIAYGSDTIYEQEQLLEITQQQKEIAAQCSKEQFDNDIKWAEKEKILKEAENKKALKDEKAAYSKRFSSHQSEWHDKISNLFTNTKAKSVYQEWKDAINNHPTEISSAFTVSEYEQAIVQYYRLNTDEVKQSFRLMAELFDKSIEKEKQLLHKFFVYQLNSNYRYLWARDGSYGIPPVTIVFDVGHDLNQKISHLQFKCPIIGTNKIIISTADELREEKINSLDVGDDDEMKYSYSNFNIIAELEFNDKLKESKNNNGVNFQDTHINLNYKNRRYVKIDFTDWDPKDRSNNKSLKINRVKIYALNDDNNIKDLAYKVKIIRANKQRRDEEAKNILNTGDLSYYTTFWTDYNYHKAMIEDRIRDSVCRGLNLLRKSRGSKISKHDKHFIKFLLCFQNERNYDEILYSAKLVMCLLRKPLDIEYRRLQSVNSEILTLKLHPKYQCDKSIVSNHKLLEWDYNKWYKPRNAMFWPSDLKPLCDEWRKLGLNLTDPQFKQLRRTSILEANKSFVTSDELAMEYLNLIAYKLDKGFQKAMKELFKQNRNNLNRQFPTGDDDLDVQSGPVKTKARQKIKCDLKYFVKPPPKCMAVLDIVRCGIVCQDEQELCCLFQLIMEKFSGSILRVKNAFDDIKKGDDSHGYRAVMININFGDESLLPKKYKMVCEAQLLLNKYYQVRKDMHLGYAICRSEDGGTSENTSPYVVLARDCTKFGKLDI